MGFDTAGFGPLLSSGSGQETSIEAKELAHLQTGMAHLSAGKLQEAVREFKKVLQATASLDEGALLSLSSLCYE